MSFWVILGTVLWDGEKRDDSEFGFPLNIIAALFMPERDIESKTGLSKDYFEGTNYKEGGQRNWVQVFCNSAVGFQICILYAFNVGLALDTPMDFKRLPVATQLNACAWGYFRYRVLLFVRELRI